MDTSNANRAFQAVWREAMGDDDVQFTARGGRFGVVMSTAEMAPEDQK